MGVMPATEARRNVVAERYLKGHTLAAIGQQFGVTATTIFRDLTAIRADWRETRSLHIDEWTAEQLAKLDKIESAAWEGWEASQLETVTTIEHTDGETTVKRVTSSGDSAFLTVIERSIEQRCKILGINSPTRTEITGADGGPIDIVTIDAVQARIAERLALAAPALGAIGTVIDVAGDDAASA